MLPAEFGIRICLWPRTQTRRFLAALRPARSGAGLELPPARSEPALFAGFEGGLNAVPDIQLPEYLLNM
jgi:hypothetical protein